jgi:hypothetical protein
MKATVITLPSSTASRVGQLVRLLGSDRAGEVVAAASAITRTLATAGADMHQLAHVAERGLRQTPTFSPEANSNVDDIVAFCSFPGNRLSDGERRFIRHLDRRGVRRAHDLTEMQMTWLLAIYYRLRSRS